MMEQEKKPAETRQLLLIIASVAFFVVIVLGVGLWLLYPGTKSPDSSGATATSIPFDVIEHVRNAETPVPIVPIGTPTPSPVSTIDLVYGQPSSAPVTAAPQTSAPQASVAPTIAPIAVATPARTLAPARTQRPAATPAPTRTRTITVTEYHIQAGSYTSRDRADQAGKQLRERGITPYISTKVVNGEQFFRLRIGPYSSKGEAEKFLAIVKAISGFGESLLFENQVQKTVGQ